VAVKEAKPRGKKGANADGKRRKINKKAPLPAAAAPLPEPADPDAALWDVATLSKVSLMSPSSPSP